MFRRVLVVLALVVSAVAGLVVTAQEPAAAVSLAIINGRIFTMDPSRPWVEAVAINGERIAAVGSTRDILAMSRTARVIDLQGAFASPGFNDAHVHIDSTGALLVGVNLLDVHESGAFTTRMREAAGRLPNGSWITRGEWGAYEKWGVGSQGSPGSQGSTGSTGSGSGPFTPTRDLIDAVTPDHPVFVNRFDRSMFLANSRALESRSVSCRSARCSRKPARAA